MNDTITKEGEKAMDRVREVSENALEKSRETLSKARASGQEVWEDAEEFVQKHPGKAVGIAALVGVFIGGVLAMTRKNK